MSLVAFSALTVVERVNSIVRYSVLSLRVNLSSWWMILNVTWLSLCLHRKYVTVPTVRGAGLPDHGER